ncbi:uncharacterized protein LOC127751568, partial [Frankliniella occidentalis]|uniref:Uncharacterized protein LOC127751568 n=1 Tax=Frankliniella occidentalis TaxID=133901 RepID=A0A9C6X904_FRAOC
MLNRNKSKTQPPACRCTQDQFPFDFYYLHSVMEWTQPNEFHTPQLSIKDVNQLNFDYVQDSIQDEQDRSLKVRYDLNLINLPNPQLNITPNFQPQLQAIPAFLQ